MMKIFNKGTGLLLIILVFVLGILLYNTFLKPAPTPAGGADGQIEATVVGDDLLKLYASLQDVNLDQTALSSRAYKSLVDFSVTVPAQQTGRTNPFGAIGQ